MWAVADASLNSLAAFRKQVHFRAAPGGAGGGSSRHGGAGADLEVPVPPGTIVRRRDAGGGEAPLAELVVPGERALLAVGGRGGRGNASVKTGRNKCGAARARAPVPAGAAGRSLRCRRPCGACARREGILTGAARAARSAPTLAEHGEAGAEMWADLELQLVADVGIVGVPNAGKSTLLGVLVCEL